jgi:hypothetical protein
LQESWRYLPEKRAAQSTVSGQPLAIRALLTFRTLDRVSAIPSLERGPRYDTEATTRDRRRCNSSRYVAQATDADLLGTAVGKQVGWTRGYRSPPDIFSRRRALG